ncbi:dab2-interacting protein, putative [Entamoeba dispar SAW760]|uniref:Dab2-interacting protein, putative n=1 Tax=Entamoeba dispar (strain ATCC PRA-260 / SAW760) TaxID=370354 RepID=B0EQ18_ENTDS|nr:dab2-interacting protein, putative [Entamoeba dispar SAW760]EDR23379.1 dab2-interacting protein, putative [Entamoeba dispar SAW760]|eukprot:EDR23379.1 dab2-interacting protein, putative [Entamoeba dispar SAW760]
MSLSGILKGIERKQFQIKTHLGIESKTKDNELSCLKEQFFLKEKRYRHYLTKVRKICQYYFCENKQTEKIFYSLRKICTEGKNDVNELTNTLNSLQQTVQLNKKEITKMEKRIMNEVILPLKEYLKQFKVIDKRIQECHRRRIDMDRIKENEQKANFIKKLEDSKNKYEKLRDELVFELNELLNNVDNSVEQLTSVMTTIFAEFYSKQYFNFNIFNNQIKYQTFNPNQFITEDKGSMVHSNSVQIATSNNYSPENRQPIKRSSSCGKQTPNYPSTYSQQLKKYGSWSSLERFHTDQINQQLKKPIPPCPSKNLFPFIQYQPPNTSKVLCLFDYHSNDILELSFNRGDVIDLLRKDGLWWFGELNGIKGYFPSNYVQIIE